MSALVKSANEDKVRAAIAAKSSEFQLKPSKRKRREETNGDEAGDDIVQVNVDFTRTINTGSTDEAPDQTSGVEELIGLVGEGLIEYYTLYYTRYYTWSRSIVLGISVIRYLTNKSKHQID